MDHSHKSIVKKMDINDERESKETRQELESIFNIKNELEMDLMERKLKTLSLKGPEETCTFNC